MLQILPVNLVFSLRHLYESNVFPKLIVPEIAKIPIFHFELIDRFWAH